MVFVSYMHFLHMCSTLNNELVSKNSIMQIMYITFFRKYNIVTVLTFVFSLQRKSMCKKCTYHLATRVREGWFLRPCSRA